MARGRGASKGVRARGRGGKGRARTGVQGRMPAQLERSYLMGKASAKIGWGASGDFRRCVAEATHHGIPGRMRPGMCARLHRKATGTWPGRGRGH